MTLNREALVSLLRLSQTAPVGRDSISEDSRLPMPIVNMTLSELAAQGLIDEKDELIEVSTSQRIRIAFLALRAGADLKRLCSLLSWREFEKIAADAFELNGYEVVRNFHFTNAKKRWEIDIVARDNPSIICVDCKHWRRGWRRSAAQKAAEAQAKRTKALAQALPSLRQRLKLEKWQKARLVPAILSLEAGPVKFLDGVPVVPALQMQDFINELPAHGDLLRSFCQNRLQTDQDLHKFVK